MSISVTYLGNVEHIHITAKIITSSLLLYVWASYICFLLGNFLEEHFTSWFKEKQNELVVYPYVLYIVVPCLPRKIRNLRVAYIYIYECSFKEYGNIYLLMGTLIWIIRF